MNGMEASHSISLGLTATKDPKLDSLGSELFEILYLYRHAPVEFSRGRRAHLLPLSVGASASRALGATQQWELTGILRLRSRVGVYLH